MFAHMFKKRKRKERPAAEVMFFPFPSSSSVIVCVCVSAVSLPGNRGGTAAGCASDHIPISCLDNEHN